MRIYINQNDREKKEDEYERIDDLENEKIEDFEKMKDYLLGLFINLKNEEDINIIFSLIDYLQQKKEGKVKDTNYKKKELYKAILNKLLDKNNLFKKEEFFSSHKNLKILLLYKLNEKGILQNNDKNEYYNNLQELMKSIKVDLYGEIKKKTLDEILKIEEPIIKRRLSLPDIILGNIQNTMN